MEEIIVTKENIEVLECMFKELKDKIDSKNATSRDFDYIYCQIARLVIAYIKYAIESESEYKTGYDLNKGLIVGLLVRIYKILLNTDKLIYTNNMTYEVALLLQRNSLELCALTQYLIKNRDNEEIFEKYRNNAIIGELKFRDQVLKDIENANGLTQPIQKRVLNSIENKFKLLQIDADKKVGRFANIEQIFTEIDHKALYDTAYRVGSHSMHADAMSTVTSDLIHNNEINKFFVNFKSNEYDIRLYNTKLMLILYALKDFINTYDFSFDKEIFIKESEILMNDIKMLEQLHEKYINEN